MGIFQRLKEIFSEQGEIKRILKAINKCNPDEAIKEYCETRSPVHGDLPTERRSCVDCKFLQSYVSWWCTNEQAKLSRGTSIPGVIHCPYWELDVKYAVGQYLSRKKK